MRQGSDNNTNNSKFMNSCLKTHFVRLFVVVSALAMAVLPVSAQSLGGQG